MIGDGMGLPQIALSYHTIDGNLALSSFPVVGLQKTYSKSHLITDSGAAATAIACGEKTYNNAIGLSADTLPIKNLVEIAEEHEWMTGLVVTSTVVHATPAAFFAHEVYRGFYEQIAADMVESGLDFIVGGGRKYFRDRAFDDRNLLKEFESKGYEVSSFKYQKFKEGLEIEQFVPQIHFTAERDPLPRFQGRKYLPIASREAAKVLDKHAENGFFLLVEGSQIDYAGHSNNLEYLTTELEDFNETIQAVLDFAIDDGETLVIVTADHECGGMSFESKRRGEKLKVQFRSKSHSSQLIPVFAYGPGSEEFRGIYENTDIFHKIAALVGFNQP